MYYLVNGVQGGDYLIKCSTVSSLCDFQPEMAELSEFSDELIEVDVNMVNGEVVGIFSVIDHDDSQKFYLATSIKSVIKSLDYLPKSISKLFENLVYYEF